MFALQRVTFDDFQLQELYPTTRDLNFPGVSCFLQLLSVYSTAFTLWILSDLDPSLGLESNKIFHFWVPHSKICAFNFVTQLVWGKKKRKVRYKSKSIDSIKYDITNLHKHKLIYFILM